MAQTVELARGTGGGTGEIRSPGPDPLIGQHLLHYEVVEVIGQGGMSVVYRGRDERLHRDVAIKVLHPFLAEKPECRMRLAREARAVARLEHPAILKVFDFSGEPANLDESPQARDRVRGFAEGFIIAELVRGQTLRMFAEKRELWRCPEVGAMVIWQVARALQHAHENGVVHRDLKPENVMVRDDGCIKLMDFGIAQIADQKGLTITGTLLGSPAHMAPECIDGHAADERSDLFSLGTVLYWICTGALPFEAHSPHALLKLIVEGRVPPAQQKSRRISDDLAKVIHKCMARRPEDRFQTAEALVAALEEMLQRSGLPASAESLEVLLSDFDGELPRARAAVRAAFLQRATSHVDEGAAARAIGCLNRVLADDTDDVDALALLERAQGGLLDEPTDPAAQLPVPTPDGLVTSTTSETPVLARGAQPPTVIEPAATTASRWVQKAALVLFAVGLIAAAVVVSYRFDDSRSGSMVEHPLSGPPPSDDGVSLETEPASGATGVITRREDPKREPRDPQIRRRKPQEPVVLPAGPVAREVQVTVHPFADIRVDGQLVAKGAKRIPVQMMPGRHTVTFEHQAAMALQREVDIPAEGPLPDVTAELEPRPAVVVVDCNIADARVSIGDRGGVTARETLARPLLVPVNKKSFRSRLDLTVFKKGYRPFNETVDLLAGQRLTRKVVLEPDADGSPVSPAPPTP